MSASESGDVEAEEEPQLPTVAQALIHKQYNLPVKAEKISVGLAFQPPSGSVADIDLSCVLFSKSGEAIDAAYYGKLSALDGAVRHCGDNTTGGAVAGEDCEVVHILPGLIPDDCCLMMFIVSGEALGSCSGLALTTYSKEPKLAKEAVVQCDLSEAGVADTACQVALAIYRTANGWIAYHICANAPPGVVSWGDVLPLMKTAARNMPTLEHAAMFREEPMQRVALPVKSDSCAIAGAVAAWPFAAQDEEQSSAESDSRFWPRMEDSAAEAAQTPKRLRVDVGWTLWDADAEGTDVQYQTLHYFDMRHQSADIVLDALQLVFYAANGDVVECGEDQGVLQGIQAAPEEDETDQADEEETPAEKDVLHPVPKGQDIDQHGFPIKDSFYLTTSALPAKVRNIVLQLTNYAGSGMAEVRSAAFRVVDASEEDPNRHQDLVIFSTGNMKGARANRSVLVLGKLSKDYSDSAYWQLRQSGGAIDEHLADQNAIRGAITAVRDQYCAGLSAEHALETALEAEENGEEDVVRPALAPFEWRVRKLGLFEKAEDAESFAEEARRVAAYEGAYNELGRRQDALAKTVYENEDMYFGAYVDDQRHGLGLYVFANKGVYAGEYQNGLRHGKGVMLMPDGGCYQGTFEADKFDGEGSYEYPDGSCYVGSWQLGKKHSTGVYWDRFGGCLQGTWTAGKLTGQSTYSQPGFVMEASYTKGIPVGPCSFSVTAFRKLHEREAACAHILSKTGPVLQQGGLYTIPAGADAEPEMDEDGNAVEDDERPRMPCYPNYEGLTFDSSIADPSTGTDMLYPPVSITLPINTQPPSFRPKEY